MATTQALQQLHALGKKLIEAASSVEFYKDEDSGEHIAQMGSKKMSLRDFLLSSKENDEKKDLVLALLNKLRSEGKDERQIVDYITTYFSEQDTSQPDVLLRRHPDDESKKVVNFDEKEIEKVEKQQADKEGHDAFFDQLKESNSLAETGKRLLSILNENKIYFENKLSQAASFALTAYFNLGDVVSADQVIDAILQAEDEFDWELTTDTYAYLEDALEKNNLEFLNKVPILSRHKVTQYTIIGTYKDEYDTDLNGVLLSEDPASARQDIIDGLKSLSTTGRQAEISRRTRPAAGPLVKKK